MTLDKLRRRGHSVALLLLTTASAAAANPPESEEDRQPQHPSGWEEHVRPVLEQGGSGVAWFPIVRTRSDLKVLDPDGFKVHVAAADEPRREHVFAAGAPLDLPSGRYRLWLVGQGRISPESAVFGVVGGPMGEGDGIGWNLHDVVPAGRVAFPAADSAAGHREVWLLHAEPPPGKSTGYELSRRRALGETVDGVAMPEGRTLAGVWDRRGRRFTALSRPFYVVAGETLPAPLESPGRDRAWLIASVGSAGLEGPAMNVLELMLSNQEKPLRPDFTFATREGVHAAWYDLLPGTAVLTGGTDRHYVEPQTIELRGGDIASFTGEFTRRPLLDVGLVLPSLIRERPFALAVRKLPEGQELLKVELPRTAGRHRFDSNLVQAPLEVVLETHVGAFRERVDLTGEVEGFITLEPQVIELWGTVRHGGDPHAARLELMTVAGDRVIGEADDTGEYRVQSLQPLRMAQVALTGVNREPWLEFFTPPLDSSRELDIDLSDAEVTVRVLDAVSGNGIDSARIMARSEYWPYEDPPLDQADWRRRHKATTTQHDADDEGVARLPPLRPGRLEVNASAEGYLPAEPVELEIPDPPEDREVELMLQPHGERVAVHLRLPGGLPAAGADVMLVDPTGAASAYFSGSADAAGVVQVPIEPRDGLLLLKHPAVAFGVLDWAEWADEKRVAWTFPPSSDVPLSLRVMDSSGQVPARHAVLSLWIGERRLSDFQVTWLLGRPPVVGTGGLWSAGRLPRETIRILAWAPQIAEQVRGGSLDTLATEIRYPWPPIIELRVVQ